MWTSYAYGFEDGPRVLRKHAQVVLHAKSLYKELVADPLDNAQFIERDINAVGIAFRLGSESFNALLQGSYSWIDDRTNDKKEDAQRLALGIEYKVAKDVWFVASIGGTSGADAADSDSFVLGELKFGSATSAQFDPRR